MAQLVERCKDYVSLLAGADHEVVPTQVAFYRGALKGYRDLLEIEFEE